MDRGSGRAGAPGEAAPAELTPGQPGSREPAGPARSRPPEPAAADRIWTVPNGISVARLAGVPVFLWLVLGPRADGWAVGLLIAAGLSDWLDGKIARAWNQQSEVGQFLDPLADRCYIAATLIGLVVRGIIPWWLFGVIVARELVMALVLLRLRGYGYEALQVSFVGKAATLCLLYAFPLLFLGEHAGTPALIARVAGWAFAIWGTVLYWWAAGLYLVQARQLMTAASPGTSADRGAGAGPADAGPR